MKRLLLIMNPAAGMKKANPHLTEILSILGAAGYECLTFMTQKRGDGTTLAAKYAASVDRIVCIGGDGTFNEVISGGLHERLRRQSEPLQERAASSARRRCRQAVEL